MSDEDAKQLAELSRGLPALDLDDVTAQRIAHRARHSVGRGPSPTRFIEPAVIAVLSLARVRAFASVAWTARTRY